MPDQIKRYNLKLPTTLYGELEHIAKLRGLSVVDVLRGFIKLGIFAMNSRGKLYIHYDDGTQNEIELIL